MKAFNQFGIVLNIYNISPAGQENMAVQAVYMRQ
jgi:hypothetical protein